MNEGSEGLYFLDPPTTRTTYVPEANYNVARRWAKAWKEAAWCLEKACTIRESELEGWKRSSKFNQKGVDQLAKIAEGLQARVAELEKALTKIKRGSYE